MAHDASLGEVLKEVQKQQVASSANLELLRDQHQEWSKTILQLLAAVELPKTDLSLTLTIPQEPDYLQPPKKQWLQPPSGDTSPQAIDAEDTLDIQSGGGGSISVDVTSSRASKHRTTNLSQSQRYSVSKHTMKNLQMTKNGPLKKVLAEMINDGSQDNLELATRWKKFRFQVNSCVSSKEFEFFTCLVIMTNMAFIGIEAELSLHNEEVSWATWVERLFLGIYTLEVLLRIVAKGGQVFRNCWFLLDFFLVCAGMLALVVAPLVGGDIDGFEKILVVRGLRLLRLARALRMVGHLKVIWRLVYGLLTAGQTMLSTTMLVLLALFICGCVAVEVITKSEALLAEPETRLIVTRHFGNLPTAILTLLQFVTLDSIAEVYFPLIVANPLLIIFFLPILIFVSIALMNLVTAVLVENALEFSAHEQETERLKTKQRVKDALPSLLEIFHEIDTDASGCVTRDEIEKVSVDVLPPRLLETVSVDSMADLFELLDVDGSGKLTQGEFVEGLLNLVLMDVPIWTIQSLKLLRLIRSQTLQLEQEMGEVKSCLAMTKEASVKRI